MGAGSYRIISSSSPIEWLKRFVEIQFFEAIVQRLFGSLRRENIGLLFVFVVCTIHPVQAQQAPPSDEEITEFNKTLLEAADRYSTGTGGLAPCRVLDG